jgi:hypothetical protein
MNYPSMLAGVAAIAFGGLCLTRAPSAEDAPAALRRLTNKFGTERGVLVYRLIYGVVPIVCGIVLMIGALWSDATT